MFLFVESVEISHKVGLTNFSQILAIDYLVFCCMESKVTEVIIETTIEGRFFLVAVTNVEEGLTWIFDRLS